MNRAEVLELLEVVASERPERLRSLARLLRAAGVGGEVAERWGVEVAGLAAATRAAAATLDQIERRAWSQWTAEGISNACAVVDLATARAGRVVKPAQRRRLERIRRKLADVADHERDALEQIAGKVAGGLDARLAAIERQLSEVVAQVDRAAQGLAEVERRAAASAAAIGELGPRRVEQLEGLAGRVERLERLEALSQKRPRGRKGTAC